MLEIEIKAKCPRSPDEIGQALNALGFERQETREEIDIYFNGNDRDFRKTDEALRLRSARLLPDGASEAFITYKGPKLDDRSQTRREIEVAVGHLNDMKLLLEQLGYQAIFTVKKQRRHYRRDSVTACVDQVEGLGNYLELEQLSQTMEARGETVEQLLALLDRLHISRDNLTRKSYLELLMISMMS